MGYAKNGNDQDDIVDLVENPIRADPRRKQALKLMTQRLADPSRFIGEWAGEKGNHGGACLHRKTVEVPSGRRAQLDAVGHLATSARLDT